MTGRSLSLLIGALVLAAAVAPQATQAQTAPLSQHIESYAIDSGRYDGQFGVSAADYAPFTHTVRVPDAPWLQLHFDAAELGTNSYLVIRSLADGAEQRLDAAGLAQWYNASAYFNGDAVEVTLHVGPGDQGVFVQMTEVVVGDRGAPETQCGPTDDRSPSNDPKAGRLLTIGCTAWLIHDDKIVSAGHCLQSGATTLQFNVPPSLPDGTLQHPGPEDQYSVDSSSRVFTNGGVGNDWGVFRVFDNSNTGLQPSQAQGAIFVVRQDLGPANIRITGYGVDSGSSNQTQQTHVGPNAGSSGTTMEYQTDTQGGNSGSPVIDEATGESVGVHTHGGCTTSGTGSNKGTSLFHTAFWDAVGEPPAPMSDVCVTIAGIQMPLDLDNGTDTFFGTSNTGLDVVSGARGTSGRTIRHHDFALMNPTAGDDPGCSGSNGSVDWLNYNGRVVGGNGTSGYDWEGFGYNSCSGYLGPRTGTITVGSCPAPRQGDSAPVSDDLIAPVATDRASLDATGPVSDAAAPLADVPEGGTTYCMTDGFGYTHDGELDGPSDILFGTGDTGNAFTWFVQGGRGTANREVRNHAFVWQNPNIDDDPGCGDGTGSVDWFTYNGTVGGSSPSYNYNFAFLNSCGSVGTGSATITLGGCRTATPNAPVASVGPAVGGATAAPDASASAGVEVTGPVALTSSPNPFAASATISYALAEAAAVRLVVYDVLGREVAVLVDEAKDAGVYSAVFDGGSLPAGTYLYRIEAGDHVQAKTMTLVR